VLTGLSKTIGYRVKIRTGSELADDNSGTHLMDSSSEVDHLISVPVKTVATTDSKSVPWILPVHLKLLMSGSSPSRANFRRT
jgi:hypothetical protein